jgi:hypothetical protein
LQPPVTKSVKLLSRYFLDINPRDCGLCEFRAKDNEFTSY